MNVKSISKKLLFKAKNSSPTIMLVSGVIGFGVTCFLSSKATLKVDAILDESREKVKTIHTVRENPESSAVYTESAMRTDLAKVYGKTAFSLAKLYGPAVITGAVSTVLVFGSHKLMSKRVAALGATVGVLSRALNKYRLQIAEMYGEEKANDIWLGNENKRVETITVDEETGEEKKQKITAKVPNEERVVSPYAFIFDETNPNYAVGDPAHNTDLLVDLEGGLNRKLRAQGYLFLNEVRMACGKKPVPEGQIVGWIYDPDDPTRQNCIDLGIEHKETRLDVKYFRAGITNSLVIDLNVDGVIVEDFFKFDKSNRV